LEAAQFSPDLTEKQIDDLNIISDASEQGIMKFCLKLHNTEELKKQNPKIFEIPFDSKKKWQLSIHE